MFATSNRHKVREAQMILAPFDIELDTYPHKGVEIQDEDVIRVVEYAAESLSSPNGIGVFIEDSGLYVNGLNGFPAAYSSYVLKSIGLQSILNLLAKSKDRTAHFDSAVALKSEDEIRVFTGRLYGTISLTPKGQHGFGFDPIFIPEGETRTLGEISMEEKCKISHRALALRRMAAWLGAKATHE